MLRALSLQIKRIESIVILVLMVAAGCAEEKNPYAGQTRLADSDLEKSGGEGNDAVPSDGTSSTDSATSRDGSESPAPPVAAKITSSLAEKLNLMCQRVISQKTEGNFSAEIGVFCTAAGAATPLLVELARTAYAGGGATPVVNKVKMHSEGKQTEMIAAGAMKLPSSLADVISRRERVFSLSVTADGVTNSFSLQKTIAAQSEVIGKCHITKQNVVTKVAIINLNNDIILKECDYHPAGKDPRVSFTLRDEVANDPANADDPLTRVINLLVETGSAETYGFTILHVIMDNKSMPGTAESKAIAQVPAFVKEYYNVLSK